MFTAFYGNKHEVNGKMVNTLDGLGTKVEVEDITYGDGCMAYGTDTAKSLFHNGLRDKLMGICNNKGGQALEVHLVEKFPNAIVSVTLDVKRPEPRTKVMTAEMVLEGILNGTLKMTPVQMAKMAEQLKQAGEEA